MRALSKAKHFVKKDRQAQTVAAFCQSPLVCGTLKNVEGSHGNSFASENLFI